MTHDLIIDIIRQTQEGNWAPVADALREHLTSEQVASLHAKLHPAPTQEQVNEALDEINAQLVRLGDVAEPIREALEAARPGKPDKPNQPGIK